MDQDNSFEVISLKDGKQTMCQSPSAMVDSLSNEIDTVSNHTLKISDQDNCFEAISSKDVKQTMCQSPSAMLDSLANEIDIVTNNHALKSLEQSSCLETLDLNQEKNMRSSSSTLLENVSDDTAVDSSSHDIKSLDQSNCLETLDLNQEKNMHSSPSTLLENVSEETAIDSSSHDIQGTESGSILKEKCSESGSLLCSINAGFVENLEDEIDINTSNSTIKDVESDSYLKENCSLSDSLACSNDAVLDENREDEIGISNNNSTFINDENYVENEEIKSPAKQQRRKRDFVNQSLSLPYYKMSRPDFHEFTNNVAKNLEVPMKSMQSLNVKRQEQILPHQQLLYQKKRFGGKHILADPEDTDIIVLCEGSSTTKRMPASGSKSTKENCGLRREDLIQQLKDQMQKKKEAAFDRHKEIQRADDEMCDSDAEEFDKILDDGDSRSPTPTNCNDEDSLTSQRNPISDSEDSCVLPLENMFFESAVESTSVEATGDLQDSDEEKCSEKDEGFMDSPSVSLSIPSYQPNGGFAVESDASSDSCNFDSDKVPPSETNGSSQSFALRNSFNFDGSQVAPFGLDEVSTICSGRFLSMDEERPWTPSSDSQANRKEDLDGRTNDGEYRDNEEELEPDKRQFKEFYEINDSLGNVSKRKICDNDALETFSPPLKKYRKDSTCDSSAIPSSLKIDEIMQDVYEKSSNIVKNHSQNLSINHFSTEALTDEITEQQTDETLNDEDAEEIGVPRIRKSRPLIIDSDDDDETNLPENQQLIEASPQKNIDGNPNPLRINDFLDEEAELSGDEMSSDESDVDDGDDEAEQELLVEDLPAEDELKEQVANIHFKHECDDDARIVKRLQQDFLPEGELHMDGSGRQRTFHWNNDVSINMQNEILSESEPEDNIESPMLQDKIKWRQETSLTQKCSGSDSSDVEGEEKTPNLKKLPVSIVGRVLSSQAAFGIKKASVSSPFTRRHGSLIHVAGSEGLNLNISSSVQRKTVLFQALSRSDKVNASSSQTFDGKSVFEKLL